MDEELAERHPRLTRGLPVPRRRLLLHIILKRPVMSGYEGPAWKRFTHLNVVLGGDLKESFSLPCQDDDDDDGAGVGARLKRWKETMEYVVDSNWRDLSVDLEAVREDSGIQRATRRVVVFRADEPHSSSHTAMIGAARVPLMKALVLGDDDDDSAEERAEQKRRAKKRRPNLQLKLAENTREFHERVQLQRWRPAEAGGEPTNVVCGSVFVKLRVTEDDGLHG